MRSVVCSIITLEDILRFGSVVTELESAEETVPVGVLKSSDMLLELLRFGFSEELASKYDSVVIAW